MVSGLNSSLSGMQSAQISQDITAHDMANVNTGGYSQRDAVLSSVNTGGTRVAQISKTPNQPNQPSNTDLASESAGMMNNKTMFTANAKAIRVQDQMVGTLLDMVG